MPLINGVISSQAFEVVRDRIAQILAEEINNQYALGNHAALNISGAWLERLIPFDKSELPAVSISLASGELDGHTQIQTDGTYTFYIDCFQSAKTTSSSDGDKDAVQKLHKLIGVCRAILEDPKYKVLGFAQPFIMDRHSTSINIAQPGKEDALSVVMGRLTFVVKVPENTELITAALIGGLDTVVKLHETSRGYVFTGGSFPNTDGYGGDVYLNNVFMRVVQEGETINIRVVDTAGVEVGEKIGDVWVVPAEGVCPSGSAVLKNTVGTTLSSTPVPSGGTVEITAPNGTVKATNGLTIGSVASGGETIITDSIVNNSEGLVAQIPAESTLILPDSEIRNTAGTLIESLPATDDYTIPNVAWTDSDGGAESTPYGNSIVCTPQVKTLELHFAFEAGDDTSALATNNSTTWTLTSLAQDGASGTITVSVNGAAYAAFVNPTTINNAQTLRVKRTSTGSAGSVTITGTYA